MDPIGLSARCDPRTHRMRRCQRSACGNDAAGSGAETRQGAKWCVGSPVSYTHLRAHETDSYL
eukprot:1557317-Pleurochrysis_carterae.AAC.1